MLKKKIMQSPTISQSEYDQRKSFLDDIKNLTKDECKEMYRILKKNNVSLSENSNGIFFDLVALTPEIFKELETFMALCRTQQSDETLRTQEMNCLRDESKNA